MTLSTYVGFIGDVDPAELHAWVNEHLLEAPHAIVDVRDDGIWNAPGQGFAAWAMTHHNNGEPVVWWTPETEMPDYWEKYGGRSAWEADQVRERAYYAKYPQDVTAYVDFDTAYGYRGDNGETCDMLHALFIMRLMDEFAEPRGLKVVWQNEYTGEWFPAPEGLQKFLGNGDKAQEWFTSVVQPMLRSTFGN